MRFNSAEEKLRALAAANATMQGFFGAPTVPDSFRWFATQLQPGASARGTCMRVTRPSAGYTQVQEGQLNTEKVMLQFDILDKSQTRSRQGVNALYTFIQSVDLMSDAQFTSPATTPTQFPNYQLSQRGPLIEFDASLQLWVWSATWRIFNNLLV